MRKVDSPTDVPNGPHYVVIVFAKKRVHHEGDERSRTNPGHGYPAYTEEIPTHTIFVTEDRTDFEAKLADLYRKEPGRTDVVALEVNRRVTVDLAFRIS